jgi:hypothetical protein
VTLFVSLVLSAATSFRCASRVMEIIRSFLPVSLPCPSWFAGRLWMLRLGYYKLTRTKEKEGDWVWIVDHTVQRGAEKCLVILGLRLSALPSRGECLSHAEVEPIALFPVKQSNGAVVYQQLEETIEQTGIPREIIADQGSDLKSGIEQFCRAHRETCSIYDIKHKTATLLKQELQEDIAWQKFTQLAMKTKNQVQQTSLAFLAPPNQRTKARYMNLESLLDWGRATLTFVDQRSSQLSPKLEPELLEAKLGWITGFREQFKVWGELLQILEATETFVRQQGLSRGCHRELEEILAPLAHTQRTQRVRHQLLVFVAEQSFQAQPNERLLGSSEVIESVFGKLKRLEHNQAKNGFTGLLLSIAAMVSTTTQEVVQAALETVPTKVVLDWCKKNLGQSLQAKRKEAFAGGHQAEQKWDQLKHTA